MSLITPLELRFPDAETALVVARILSGNSAVEALPPDGSLGGIGYDIAIVNGTGIVYPPPATIPAAFTPYLIPAGTTGVAFG